VTLSTYRGYINKCIYLSSYETAYVLISGLTGRPLGITMIMADFFDFVHEMYSVSQKKNSRCSFYLVSTCTDRFLQYLAQSILRKYATQKLLICPSHLHNATALP